MEDFLNVSFKFRRGRIEKALSLAVDLAAWDLFADARWAANKHNLPHLAEEAGACAAHYARLDRPGEWVRQTSNRDGPRKALSLVVDLAALDLEWILTLKEIQ